MIFHRKSLLWQYRRKSVIFLQFWDFAYQPPQYQDPTSLTKSVATTFALTDQSFRSIRIDYEPDFRQYWRNKLNPKGFKILEFRQVAKNPWFSIGNPYYSSTGANWWFSSILRFCLSASTIAGPYQAYEKCCGHFCSDRSIIYEYRNGFRTRFPTVLPE